MNMSPSRLSRKSVTTPGILPALLLLAALLPATAHAEDPADMIKAHCTACHGTEVYTRSNRRVQDRSQLGKQVQRCQLSQGLQWFDDDVEAVADYLNKQYYKF